MFKGCPDGGQQCVIIEGLRQELDCPRLHGPDCRGYIAVASDEDDRHIRPFGGDKPLEV
jgi:hypothetical protein